MKTYITFGQTHVHEINGKLFDKDCVAVIEVSNPSEGRARAFQAFGPVFCMEYFEEEWSDSWMRNYPRGYINLD